MVRWNSLFLTQQSHCRTPEYSMSNQCIVVLQWVSCQMPNHLCAGPASQQDMQPVTRLGERGHERQQRPGPGQGKGRKAQAAKAKPRMKRLFPDDAQVCSPYLCFAQPAMMHAAHQLCMLQFHRKGLLNMGPVTAYAQSNFSYWQRRI